MGKVVTGGNELIRRRIGKGGKGGIKGRREGKRGRRKERKCHKREKKSLGEGRQAVMRWEKVLSQKIMPTVQNVDCNTC